jgi:adenosylmethionine-8-amino-7-oxononanoate aminotransferase
MMNEKDFLDYLKLQHVWHPCSQKKNYKDAKLMVSNAGGSYLTLANGQKIIDAISSWWCKSLGHNHPRLKQALINQIDKFEHTILANTTNETIVKLSEKLATLMPNLNKVFYASDGSSAIEIAMKMSLHTRQIQGNDKKLNFISLQNSYHGETIGALSLSDIGVYRKPYQSLLFNCHFISNVPYVLDSSDPLWDDCSAIWQQIEDSLKPFENSTTAIIVEPIVQGAAGMKIYSRDFLRRLYQWSQAHGVHFIADEIMTGIGRTGKMLACEHANIVPDFICLSKGLTSGWLPLSAVITNDEIYNYFHKSENPEDSFLHSHTYCGNALAAAVALEVLHIIEEDNILVHANELGAQMHKAMWDIQLNTNKIENIRQIGAIVAADLICERTDNRVGFELAKKMIELGALLRPIGNTIYWCPPLNMDFKTLEELKDITEVALINVGF